MSRFLCVLLLVGLVATPRSEPDVQSSAGTGETRQTLSGASLPALVGSSRATRGPVPDGVPSIPATRITGVATWFDAPSPRDAAAGPSLRKALGRHWRGSTVRVSSRGRSVVVRLTDWCLCSRGDRVIDLDDAAFSRLAPLGVGVIPVSVTWERAVPLAPATDVR